MSETITPTVIRIPRMHARPPILPGSKVIRSNLLSLPADISSIAAVCIGMATGYRITSTSAVGNRGQPCQPALRNPSSMWA